MFCVYHTERCSSSCPNLSVTSIQWDSYLHAGIIPAVTSKQEPKYCTWEAKPSPPSTKQRALISVKFMHFALVTVEFHSLVCSEQNWKEANHLWAREDWCAWHSPASTNRSVCSKGFAEDNLMQGGPKGTCREIQMLVKEGSVWGELRS